MILIACFIGGILVGFFLRGVAAKTEIAKLQNEEEMAKVTTRIERERLKQHRMLDERMQ